MTAASAVVSREQRRQPAGSRLAVGIEEDKQLTGRRPRAPVACDRRVSASACRWERDHHGTGPRGGLGRPVGRAVVYHQHLDAHSGRLLRQHAGDQRSDGALLVACRYDDGD